MNIRLQFCEVRSWKKADAASIAPLADNRKRFEAAWQTPIPTRPGLNLLKMMDAAFTSAVQGRFPAEACGFAICHLSFRIWRY